MPRFNPLNVCGYHIRDAGATAVEEVGADPTPARSATSSAPRERGIDPDRLAPRVSFFWDVHNDFLEEVAKLRAARRLWARLTRERLRLPRPALVADARALPDRRASRSPRSSRSTTSRAPPSRRSRRSSAARSRCTRTRSTRRSRSRRRRRSRSPSAPSRSCSRSRGVADVVDPFGGSYYVESLTSRIEEEAADLIGRIDAMGGMIEAITSASRTRSSPTRPGSSSSRSRAGADHRRHERVRRRRPLDRRASRCSSLDPGVQERQIARLPRSSARARSAASPTRCGRSSARRPC